MTIALLKYRDTLYALFRGEARTLSAQELSGRSALPASA
jgi:hypothetical protein